MGTALSTLLFWVSKLINPFLSPLTLAILIPAAALVYIRRAAGAGIFAVDGALGIGGVEAEPAARSARISVPEGRGRWIHLFRRAVGPSSVDYEARRVHRVRFLASAGLAVLGALWLASMPAVSNVLVRAWETERVDPAILETDGNAPFDAIIVLGGSVSVELSEGWHIESGQSMERLHGAARLYRRLAEGLPAGGEGLLAGEPGLSLGGEGSLPGVDEAVFPGEAGSQSVARAVFPGDKAFPPDAIVRRAPKIIVTGGSGNPAFQDRSEAPLMLELLTLMGVPEEDVILEGNSRNTYENAVFTKAVMQEEGLRSAVLVTSALHMRRSRAIFAKQGYTFTPFTVDTSVNIVPPPNNFFPDTLSLDNTYRTVREIVGYAVYRAMGRL